MSQYQTLSISKLQSFLAEHLLNDCDGVIQLVKSFVDVVDLDLQSADGVTFDSAERVVENWVQDLHFEALGEFLAVSEFFLEVDHQLHAFVEFVVEELEDLEDVLADGHLLLVVLQDGLDVLLDLGLLDLVLVGLEGDEWEADGDDVLDLHELPLGGHVEPPLLLDGVVGVVPHEILLDLSLTPLVDATVRVHFVVLLEDVLVVEVLLDNVGYAIAEVDEDANDDQLEDVLVQVLVQDLLLVRPVQNQDGRLLEVDLFVVSGVVLVELVDEVLLIQELLAAVQLLVVLQQPDSIEYQFCPAVSLDEQFL